MEEWQRFVYNDKTNMCSLTGGLLIHLMVLESVHVCINGVRYLTKSPKTLGYSSIKLYEGMRNVAMAKYQSAHYCVLIIAFIRNQWAHGLRLLYIPLNSKWGHDAHLTHLSLINFPLNRFPKYFQNITPPYRLAQMLNTFYLFFMYIQLMTYTLVQCYFQTFGCDICSLFCVHVCSSFSVAHRVYNNISDVKRQQYNIFACCAYVLPFRSGGGG